MGPHNAETVSQVKGVSVADLHGAQTLYKAVEKNSHLAEA